MKIRNNKINARQQEIVSTLKAKGVDEITFSGKTCGYIGDAHELTSGEFRFYMKSVHGKSNPCRTGKYTADTLTVQGMTF